MSEHGVAKEMKRAMGTGLRGEQKPAAKSGAMPATAARPDTSALDAVGSMIGTAGSIYGGRPGRLRRRMLTREHDLLPLNIAPQETRKGWKAREIQLSSPSILQSSPIRRQNNLNDCSDGSMRCAQCFDGWPSKALTPSAIIMLQAPGPVSINPPAGDLDPKVYSTHDGEIK
eukprot:1760466-Rhodomonas_salina.8